MSAEQIHKFGVKVLVQERAPMTADEVSAVFQRWIQAGSLPGLLIDVADYSHVPEGPGVLLVAHEGNYALDDTDGLRGMVYYAKRYQPGTAAERLARTAGRALTALAMLLEEPGMSERLAADTTTLEIFVNDRLHARNDAQSHEAVTLLVGELVQKLFGPVDYDIETPSDPRSRFALRLHVKAAAADYPARSLAQRLAA